MNLETMKSQFTGEYRAAFDGAYKYILMQNFPSSYSDEKMAELYDLLLTAQEEGRPAEKIVGADPEAFCREFFSDFAPENRLAGELKKLFAVACVLLFFAVTDWRCAEEVLPFGQFRLNASPFLCGLACGAGLNILFRLLQPLVMKTRKISAGGWATIYCCIMLGSIFAATALMHGRELSVPGAPVLIVSGAYVLLYPVVRAILRYRRTGSIFAKKADDPYKDSYYKTLEDKDLRRFIEKQWMRRYRRLERRGKVTAETFRSEIERLEKYNAVSQHLFTGFAVFVVVFATVMTALDSTVFDTVCFFCLISAAEYFVWKLFHKADLSNAALRRHILADCDASGMNLPEFLAQELDAAR